jgi:hypothetical protein
MSDRDQRASRDRNDRPRALPEQAGALQKRALASRYATRITRYADMPPAHGASGGD